MRTIIKYERKRILISFLHINNCIDNFNRCSARILRAQSPDVRKRIESRMRLIQTNVCLPMICRAHRAQAGTHTLTTSRHWMDGIHIFEQQRKICKTNGLETEETWSSGSEQENETECVSKCSQNEKITHESNAPSADRRTNSVDDVHCRRCSVQFLFECDNDPIESTIAASRLSSSVLACVRVGVGIYRQSSRMSNGREIALWFWVNAHKCRQWC